MVGELGRGRGGDRGVGGEADGKRGGDGGLDGEGRLGGEMEAVSEGYEKLYGYGIRPMDFCYHDLSAPCEVTGVML